MRNAYQVIADLGPHDARVHTWESIIKCIHEKRYIRVMNYLDNMRHDGDFQEAFEVVAQTVVTIHG